MTFTAAKPTDASELPSLAHGSADERHERAPASLPSPEAIAELDEWDLPSVGGTGVNQRASASTHPPAPISLKPEDLADAGEDSDNTGSYMPAAFGARRAAGPKVPPAPNPPTATGPKVRRPSAPPAGPLEIELDRRGPSEAPGPMSEDEFDLPAPRGAAGDAVSLRNEFDLAFSSAAGAGRAPAPSVGEEQFEVELPSPISSPGMALPQVPQRAEMSVPELEVPAEEAELPGLRTGLRTQLGGGGVPRPAPAAVPRSQATVRHVAPGRGVPAAASAALPDVPELGDPALPDLGDVGLPGRYDAPLPDLGAAGLPATGGAGLPELGGAGLPDLGGAGLPGLGGAGLPELGGAGLPIIRGAGLPAATLGGTALPASAGSHAGPAEFDFGAEEAAPLELEGFAEQLASAPSGASSGTLAGLSPRAPSGPPVTSASSGGFASNPSPQPFRGAFASSDPRASTLASLGQSGAGTLAGLGAAAGAGLLQASAPSAPPRIAERSAAPGDFSLPDLGDGEADPFGAREPSLHPQTVPSLEAGSRASDPSLPPARPSFADDFGEMEFPGAETSPASAPRPPVHSPTLRSTSEAAGFGEVSLDTGAGGPDFKTEIDAPARQLQPSMDEADFGAGAGEASLRGPDVAAAVPVRVGAAQGKLASARGGRKMAWFGATALALVVGGGALYYIPDVGPYGAYFIIDTLGREEQARLLRSLVNETSSALARDDYSTARDLSARLTNESRQHQRQRELGALAALAGSLIELRHGENPQIHSTTKVALEELAKHRPTPLLLLAQAARAGLDGNLPRARAGYDASRSALVTADPLAFSARLFMLERKPAQALVAWREVEQREHSARASFGMAETLVALGQFAEAQQAGETCLTRNPEHLGARLLLARLALEQKGDGAASEKYVSEVLARESKASELELVAAQTQLGELQLSRSRISLAEAAFGAALRINPRAAGALAGLGEALYRAGRYSEALARFEAGSQADPDNVTVAVGVGKSQIALERNRDALTLLQKLRLQYPQNFGVAYWYGRVLDLSGNREEADKTLEAAIVLGKTEPVVVDAYVALATLRSQAGKRGEAQALLAQALEKMPRSAKIHESLGQLALSEGRYAEAISEYQRSLELEPRDVGGKFRLGVAYRKNREFDKALALFDEVSKQDREFPGLALERGQLYEASGRTAEALASFEAALAKAPNDADLMLRVGCSKVAAGHSGDAVKLLNKVLEQRASSAETHHCLGRAQLLEGTNLALALRTLEHAVELDPHRAEYHLYVGWAANEAGRVGLAESALKRALELDQGLGDAYWQRGVLRKRQGAVKDAVTDLNRALELKPGRVEAHATIAEAYYDLGLEQKALEHWRAAVTAMPDMASWRYSYGKLLAAAGRDGEARTELEKSLELGAKLEPKPIWAWEAHHLLARTLGASAQAIGHWQEFLKGAPMDNVYRAEARKALERLGKPWDGP